MTIPRQFETHRLVPRKWLTAILLALVAVGGTAASDSWTQADVAKPQTPTPPFPYETREVTIPSSTPDVSLAGELTLPRAVDQRAAILMLSVAGPNDRDMAFQGHHLFKVIADQLTRGGYVTLRLDDRGVGGSGGNVLDASYEVLVEDVFSAVEFLEQQHTVDPAKIGILGISEGGGIAIKALAASPEVAFGILLSAPGVKGNEAISVQLEQNLMLMGLDDSQKEEARALFSRFSALLHSSPSSPRVREELTNFLEGPGRSLVPPYSFMPKTAREQAGLFLGPWYQSQWHFDPQPDLALIHKPVLAIAGGKDMVLPAATHMKAIERILRESRNPDITVHVIPGLNHLMQTAITGSPMEYAALDETISPQVLEIISEWLVRRF